MDLVDRIMIIAGEIKMKELYVQYIEKMIQQNTWQSIHASIMTLSQIGEYFDLGVDDVDMQKMDKFMQFIEA